jgi:(1->4)-alpha-D-glucan 1-alpha-D-glucosylmutase
MNSARIPLATYRLQFNRNFTFKQATELVPYLAELGISHCYASPYLKARPGSTHGYDIIDHNVLNPEIGTVEEFDSFVAALREHGMGQILDIVPNHMGVMGADNAWWLDVLENGQASTYAEFFDIDWEPLKDELQFKVLVPVLGDQYGTVLDRGEFKLKFDAEKGEFSIFYYQHRFPIDPREYPRILVHRLERLERQLGPQDPQLLELKSLIAAFNHLPGRRETEPDKIAERSRDKEIHKRRLAALCNGSAELLRLVEENAYEISGTCGSPRSFDELHELIKTQAYRLAYWRVAADDINYRRFSDINDLAALRMEQPSTFEATHRLVRQLVNENKLDGLRIDHPDGLHDPATYFRRLQGAEEESLYIVVEKILTGEERLAEGWPVHGTTGYEFANLVNGLFVDPAALFRMDRIYRSIVGRYDFSELLHDCKKIVMDGALASELNVLASLLSRIALSDRHTCDFTLNGLRDALSEIVANFPVYRTYITEHQVSETDRDYIDRAVHAAKRQSAASDTSVFDFVRDVLLARKGEGQTGAYRHSVVLCAMKFQQLTSAVMAKGLEDTSFYRYNRLVSLNDVGGDPRIFGQAPAEFHRRMEERARRWPHTMLATSTHDSKRSEDVRARINVLSELPVLWRRRVRRWRELNHTKKRLVDGQDAPTRNDEYLLYQTLIGAWPIRPEDQGDRHFEERIRNYMLKAVREAKEKTSWANPNVEYENAVAAFVKALLSPTGSNEFLSDFVPFQSYISRIGMFNSLSQLLIKIMSPGVPDIYQGNELWDFSLVDPDNRRTIDYSVRRQFLRELESWAAAPDKEIQGHARELAESVLTETKNDGRLKLYVTHRALQLRRQFRPVFQDGEYMPLPVVGERADHVVAFARRRRNSAVLVAVPRLCARLLSEPGNLPLGAGVWKDTRVALPCNIHAEFFHNAFTCEDVMIEKQGDTKSFPAATLLANFPVALLASERLRR